MPKTITLTDQQIAEVETILGSEALASAKEGPTVERLHEIAGEYIDALDLMGREDEAEALANEFPQTPSETGGVLLDAGAYEVLISVIVGAAKSAGFNIDAETVKFFAKEGSVEASTIGDEYDEALTDTLLGIFDALNLEVG